MRRNDRIFIVYYDLGIGGVQRKIIDIVNYIYTYSEYSHSTIHILLEHNSASTLERLIHNPNVSIERKPVEKMPYWAFILWRLLQHKPASVLTFLPYSAYHVFRALQLLWGYSPRFVISEDVITSHAYARGDFSPEIQAKIPEIFSSAHTIIVPSNTIKLDLARNYNVLSTHISILSNWCSGVSTRLKRYKPMRCVYVGRFDPEKRIPLMVQLFQEVLQTLPTATLSLMGSGKDLQNIQRLITDGHLSRNIRVFPPSHSSTVLLRRARVALFTSESEGMPMFLLEALAAGLPIVAMRFPGVSTIITNDVSGVVCDTKSEYIRALKWLLKDDEAWKRLGMSAQHIAKTRFSVTNINQYVSVLFQK